ncbi:MAG: double-strand break repair protein AddB, partial [Jannaschia sp.]
MTGIAGLYHEPLGVDFSRAVVAGLRSRLDDPGPEALSRVTILANTNRMAARLRAAFAEGGATLLPRIGLVSQIQTLLPPGALPPVTASALSLRLRLTELVRHLLLSQPDLSPPSAAFDLAGTLVTLLSEMQEEAMVPGALDRIDPRNLSRHWQRSLQFLQIVTDFIDATPDVTGTALQALALDALKDYWISEPPPGPVIVVGSTASRAQTRVLIDRVLSLPQGAVILP